MKFPCSLNKKNGKPGSPSGLAGCYLEEGGVRSGPSKMVLLCPCMAQTGLLSHCPPAQGSLTWTPALEGSACKEAPNQHLYNNKISILFFH